MPLIVCVVCVLMTTTTTIATYIVCCAGHLRQNSCRVEFVERDLYELVGLHLLHANGLVMLQVELHRQVGKRVDH